MEEKLEIPEWIRNACYGIGQVACVALLEGEARRKGFQDGQMDGKRRGALIALNAAKRRFGSKNQQLLAEYMAQHDKEEFFDE